MKVKLSETVEVTDEQRTAIGEMLGKKQASRDECRDFIWRSGRDWALLLNRTPEFMEDLIGEDYDPVPGLVARGVMAEPDAELADLI